MLTPGDIALHEALGITSSMLERMQVRRVTDREAREVLALNGRPGRLDGVLYPYLHPLEHRPQTYRVRRDHPEFENGKTKNKYLSAYGDRRHLYFVGAEARVLADANIPVIIVEAEKSGMAVFCAAETLGRPVLAIGLGGCWGWRGRIGKVDLPNGGHTDEKGPISDLDRITWAKRDTVLAFDSNAATNPAVQAARRAFGLELARRGACVRVLDLQPEDGINGPDDLIGRHGADRFFALVDAAPDAATFDVIFRLNQRNAVVREGGKTLVVTETCDPVLHRRVLTRSTFADFKNFHMRERVRVGVKETGLPIYKSLGHVWLHHPDRRQYEGIVMSPDREIPGYLNLWQGFAVSPQPGSCQRYKQHVFEVICGGNATLFDYVFGWMAAGVQHPERQAEVALALRGQRGTGKGIFARPYGELFGQHYLQIANTKHLTGHFNAHLQDTIVLFADEAFWAGDKAGESVLKMLITEPVISIERKGQDVIPAKNLLHIILASNHEWVVPAGADERRFCVIEVDPGHQNDHAYFAALVRELDEAGGRAALLHELLHHPLAGFDVRAVPQTEALRQQKVLSMPPNERWLFDKLMGGRLLSEHDGWVQVIQKDDLHNDYLHTMQRVGIERRATETELGMFITKKLGDAARPDRRMLNGKRRPVWLLADLDTCRSAFDGATKSHHPWPKVTDEKDG